MFDEYTQTVGCMILINLFLEFLFEKIAKGTTDPGIDCFDQSVWFGRFGLVGLVW